MTEICLAKGLVNTLWLQLNQKNKNRPLKYLLKRKRKNKITFGIPLFKGTEEEFSRAEILTQLKKCESEAKNIRRKLPPNNWKKRGFQGKNKHKGNLQHVFSTYNSNRRSEKCSSLSKKLALCKNSSKLVTSRKVKSFFGSMGLRDTYKGPRNFGNCKGVQETFSKKSDTGENSPHATYGSGTSNFNTSGDRENVEEGSHTAKIAWSRGVFEQYFLGREKRWEKSTCGELKIPKPAHSTSAFQTGSLFYLRESLQERDYMCKLDMKDAYFSVPLHPPSRSYIRFSWSGNPYEFHCLCSGLWPAPTIFTKLPIIPMYILRRMNVWIVTCLDDMLMIG